MKRFTINTRKGIASGDVLAKNCKLSIGNNILKFTNLGSTIVIGWSVGVVYAR